MPAGMRYRTENGRSCIDLKVRHSRQLFDGRDPAPFNERDLDDDAVAYLLAAAQEIPRKQALTIAVTISEETEPRLAPDAIVEAVRGHFVYEREQIERRLHEHVRRGHIILGVGVSGTRHLPDTSGANRVAAIRSSARDSPRRPGHHGVGRDVATTRSPPL